MTEGENNLQQLPKGWVFLTLNDVAADTKNSIKRGPFGSAVKKEYFAPSGYKVYEQQNIIYNDFSLGNYYIDEKKFAELKDFELKGGDIVISCSGTIGKIAIAPQNIEKGIINQALLKITLDDAKIFSKYFLYLFTSDMIQKRILTRGTAMTNISSVKALKQILFPIPPINEQRRIVGKMEELFTQLDAGLESLKKVKTQLKRYRQAVLKYAFEGKLTEEWRKTHKDQIEPAHLLLKRIKEGRKKNAKRESQEPLGPSVFPRLPEEWTYTRLDDICGFVDRVNPENEPEKEFTYLEIASIDNHQKITAPRRYLGKDAPSRARQLVKRGDTLFSTVRTYLRHIAIVDEIYDGQIASTGFCVIRPWKPINSKWVFYLVQTDDFINPLTKIQRGTSYPAVRDSDVFAQVVPFAPLVEQEKIVEEIERQLSVADGMEKVMEQSLKQAERLRQSILKKAFEGKLVPQDPYDEPAEKLLERIKEERVKRKVEESTKKKNKIERGLKQMELMRYVK